MVDLLSHHLYSGPQVYLRELLQNAVDGITARRSIDPDAEATVRLVAGPAVITGRLRGVGQDVLVVERDDGPDTFVALAALAEVVVDP